jgi:anthranilate phosphoribosyltransferase
VALNAAAGMTAYQMTQLITLDEFDLMANLSENFLEASKAIADGRALAKLHEWVSASQSFGE